MADSPTTLRDQLAQFWAGLSRSKRIALITVTLTVLCGVMAVSTLGARQPFVPL
jgi:ABC-type spermidine/putrescine transport system permease subunit II